jgi:hypothetical protein
VYVSKDMGVIMFIVAKNNSDVVWTINKPINSELVTDEDLESPRYRAIVSRGCVN